MLLLTLPALFLLCHFAPSLAAYGRRSLRLFCRVPETVFTAVLVERRPAPRPTPAPAALPVVPVVPEAPAAEVGIPASAGIPAVAGISIAAPVETGSGGDDCAVVTPGAMTEAAPIAVPEQTLDNVEANGQATSHTPAAEACITTVVTHPTMSAGAPATPIRPKCSRQPRPAAVRLSAARQTDPAAQLFRRIGAGKRFKYEPARHPAPGERLFRKSGRRYVLAA